MSRVRYYTKMACLLSVLLLGSIIMAKYYFGFPVNSNLLVDASIAADAEKVDLRSAANLRKNNDRNLVGFDNSIQDSNTDKRNQPALSNDDIGNALDDLHEQKKAEEDELDSDTHQNQLVKPLIDEERKETKPFVMLNERIVHLDLKGAPPTVTYLQELFPLFRKLGATGLLMEYEDMFPYYGNFSVIRSGYAYSKDELKAILNSARENNLSVIPLVQTLGHMEWVLKHQRFSSIREVSRYPQVSCPSNDLTLKIVKRLIDQIVSLHPNITAIHIGADEAYYIGTECNKCKNAIKELGTKQKLMLQYVMKVAKYIKKKHNLRVLTWNDMYQDAEPEELKETGVNLLIEPVVWGYSTNLVYSDYFPPGLFKRFGAAFPTMWVASAFKGANGPAQTFIDIDRYAENHLSWIHFINLVKADVKNFSGIILTGWSRFDHFALLCELMSTGLPSLAVDLQLMMNGGNVSHAYVNARRLLNCNESAVDKNETFPEMELFRSKTEHYSADVLSLPMPPLGTTQCIYPGSRLTALVYRLHLIRHATNLFLMSNEVQGWLSEYTLKEQYGSVFMAEHGYNKTQQISGFFKGLLQELMTEMKKYYYAETVNEWLYENIQVHLNKLDTIARSTYTLMRTTAFRNRPLPMINIENVEL